MAAQDFKQCIVFISAWESLKIHFYSCLCGFVFSLRKCFWWLWKSDEACCSKKEMSPPDCLLDSKFGVHSYIKLKGIKFHYVESGNKKNPLLILLHGFPDFWLGWSSQIPLLAEHFRVVALDMKGFGDSDKPQWRSNYRIDTLVSELSKFVNALGSSTCSIIGHDLGGQIGWYFIHQYPDMVDKFVAISSPHPNLYWCELPRTSTFNSRWVHFSQLPYLPEIDALKENLSIINQCFSHLQKRDCEYVEAYKYTFSRKEDWTGPINYYRNLPFSRVNRESEVLQVPCLLITGNKDKFINLESVVKSNEYAEKSRVKIIQNAEHFPHQEMPEEVNKILLSFLVKPKPVLATINKEPSKGFINKMYGATLQYGNRMVDAVQKKTNVMTGLPTKILYLGQNS